MRFNLKYLFAALLVIGLIFAGLRSLSDTEQADADVYVEYLGLTEEGVESRILKLLKQEGYREVRGWDPQLGLIPTKPPKRGGGELEVYVTPERYFEKETDHGTVGCALGIDLDYVNKGACNCRVRCYISGRAAYWRWTPGEQRAEPFDQVASLKVVVTSNSLVASMETQEILFQDREKQAE